MEKEKRMLSRSILYGMLVPALIFTAATNASGQDGVPLVPRPQEVTWTKAPVWEIEEGDGAIVVGGRATEPEKLAAEILHERVAKRFGADLPILSEKQDLEPFGHLILLGQRTTNGLLDEICTEYKIELGPESPGHDGYVIDMVERGKGKTRVAIVGGSEPRGVLYGQDTLFQLLSSNGGRILVTRASIRDWPTVPWRGRPQTNYENYLRPGEWVTYVTSRVNWIDLRNGTYAFEPGTELDREAIAKVIQEGHRCGFVVFGTVNCGVSREKYPDVLKTFREFIDLGVDGLWISFDDKGPGDAAEEIVFQVVELAGEHGISGNQLAICPPKGSYQNIDTEFDRKIAAVPGMEEALWYFTVVPSPESLEDGYGIGLTTKPSWWHNWTRPHSGFTHISSSSQLAEGKQSYMNVPPLSEGWHSPSYVRLALGADCVQSIMPWGGNSWGQYYIVPVIGWWGWNPKGHDWDQVRSRIYDIVYGPGQVSSAMEFDNTLIAAESLFEYPWDTTEWQPLCPPRLDHQEYRNQALSHLGRLDRLQLSIADRAADESLLPAEQVKTTYLDAMRVEVDTGEVEAAMPYPEYWWDDHQRKVLDAVYDGDMERADKLIASVRDRVVADVERIGKELGYLRAVPGYVDWWKERAALDAEGWRDLVDRRRKELKHRVWDYGYYHAKTSTMLGGSDDPPLGWGTGRWEKDNQLLATVVPTRREQSWGDWMGGVYDATPAAVFAQERKSWCSAGDYSELGVEIPVSGNRKRLALMIFLSNHTKDSIGFDEVRARWAGRQYIRLLWDRNVLWEADLGRHRLEGEWFVVKLPDIPDTVRTLRLALRVENEKPSVSSTIAFVGPIRLVEIPE